MYGELSVKNEEKKLRDLDEDKMIILKLTLKLHNTMMWIRREPVKD